MNQYYYVDVAWHGCFCVCSGGVGVSGGCHVSGEIFVLCLSFSVFVLAGSDFQYRMSVNEVISHSLLTYLHSPQKTHRLDKLLNHDKTAADDVCHSKLINSINSYLTR